MGMRWAAVSFTVSTGYRVVTYDPQRPFDLSGFME